MSLCVHICACRGRREGRGLCGLLSNGKFILKMVLPIRHEASHEAHGDNLSNSKVESCYNADGSRS